MLVSGKQSSFKKFEIVSFVGPAFVNTWAVAVIFKKEFYCEHLINSAHGMEDMFTFNLPNALQKDE